METQTLEGLGIAPKIMEALERLRFTVPAQRASFFNESNKSERFLILIFHTTLVFYHFDLINNVNILYPKIVLQVY